jgi:hypothetical protein
MQQSNSDEHPDSHMKEESCFWVLTLLSKTLVFVRLFRICDIGLLSLLNKLVPISGREAGVWVEANELSWALPYL